MSREYYLIDGYNVINCWDEFAELREQQLEHAREVLIHRMSEFMAFHGYRCTIVFDAMDVKGPGSVEEIGGLQVVYTAEKETADSWIEREAYQSVRAGFKVFVVTSDRAEQDSILGSGGYRISAREFNEDYRETKKAIAVRTETLPGRIGRRELGGRIDENTAILLEQIRRNRHH